MSSELNYYRIAQILGGTITETAMPTFGPMGAAQSSVERLRLIGLPPREPEAVPMDQNGLLVQVFERVREGYELDRVLVDPMLSRKLITEAHKAGVKGTAIAINRRLQAIRKNWKAYGVKFADFTQAADLEPQPYFYAAELGYVQLNYRRDASVDDIITDPNVGDAFVALCKGIKPEGRAMDFKWAALRLRKMRYFKPQKVEKLLAIKAEEIEGQMRFVGTLDRLTMDAIPVDSGLYSFIERDKQPHYLYVGAADRLREAISPFADAKPFRAVAGRLWQPLLSEISLNVGVIKRKKAQPNARDLSFRLIDQRHPLFNMGVQLKVSDDNEAED